MSLYWRDQGNTLPTCIRQETAEEEAGKVIIPVGVDMYVYVCMHVDMSCVYVHDCVCMYACRYVVCTCA